MIKGKTHDWLISECSQNVRSHHVERLVALARLPLGLELLALLLSQIIVEANLSKSNFKI